MSGIFKKPKAPKVIEPPPTPVVDQSLIDRQQADMLRRRRGRAATDLTSGGAGSTAGSVATQQLLGS